MSADHTCQPWMNVNPSAMLVRCPRIVVFTATEMWPPMKQHSGLFLLSVCQCPVVTIMKLCVTISALNETHCSERHCMLYGEFSSYFFVYTNGLGTTCFVFTDPGSRTLRPSRNCTWAYWILLPNLFHECLDASPTWWNIDDSDIATFDLLCWDTA